MMKKRYCVIDVSRFICSLLVVCIHMNPFSDINTQLDLIISGVISTIAVPFFFVASGYFAYYTDTHKCMKRAILLLGGWSLFYLIWLRFWMINPKYLLLLIFSSGGYYHLWYLLMLIYSIVFCKVLLKNLPLKVGNLFCFFCYIAGVIFRTYIGMDTEFGLWLFRFFSVAIPSYYSGMMIRKNKAELIAAEHKVSIVILVLFWITEIIIKRRLNNGTGYTLLFSTLFLAIAFFSITYQLSLRLNIKIAKVLGSISTIIYCLHPFVIKQLDNVITRFSLCSLHSLQKYCIVVIICIIAGILGYTGKRCIKKNI